MLIKKILDISGYVTTTVVDIKIKEVDNKISDLGGLVNKTDYDVKISEIEGKHFTTSDYNKFTSDTLHAKIKQNKVVTKFNVSNLKKNSDWNTVFYGDYGFQNTFFLSITCDTLQL